MTTGATAKKKQPELAHCSNCGCVQAHEVTSLLPVRDMSKTGKERGKGKPVAVSVFDRKRNNLVETRRCLACGCTQTIRTDDPMDWPHRSQPKPLAHVPELPPSERAEPAMNRRFCAHCDRRTIHSSINSDDPNAPPAETNEFLTLAPEARCWDCGTIQFKVVYHKEITSDDVSLYRNSDLKRLRRGR